MLRVGALLETTNFPEADPAVCGLKLTVTATDWFGFKIILEPPVTPKPVPVAETVEMSTSAFPVFVSSTLCVVVVPTVTLPKFKLVGLAESVTVAATPVPER